MTAPLLDAADAQLAGVGLGLDLTTLQMIIAAEEADMIRRFGAHGDGVTAVTEVCEGGYPSIWLRRPAVSITSITEALVGGDAETVLSSDYYRYTARGQIMRLPAGARWGFGSSLTADMGAAWQPIVTVTYVPVDDQQLRKEVLLNLVRIATDLAPAPETTISSLGNTVTTRGTAINPARLRQQQLDRLAYREF